MSNGWAKGPTNMFEAELYGKFFRNADSNRDGYMSFSDMKLMCQKNRYAISESHLWYCFTEPNRGGDYNRLSFHDFMVAMGLRKGEWKQTAKKVEAKKPAEDESFRVSFLKHIFKMFDKDGNGVIDRNELKEVFKELGRDFTDSQITKIMKSADTDGSMCLSYDEFVKVLTSEGLASGAK